MSIYVHYQLGSNDGLQARFLADLNEFLEWFSPLVEKFPDDYPVTQLQKARDIMQRGAPALETESDDEAHLIDRIVDEYWSFCDIKNLHHKSDITHSAQKWNRYASELSEVVPTASTVANTYYRSLFCGRSLAKLTDHRYKSEDGIFHLSWLLPQEITEFRSELEPFEYQLDRNDDRAVGVLWVLHALRQADQQKVSLVVAIA